MPRYRIAYAKTGPARFLSHLDLLRTFNRAFRRAGLPLVYSEGFSPHPKASYGPPLGVGVAGLNEYLDLDLSSEVAGSEAAGRLTAALPPGLAVNRMEPAPAGPGLCKLINCAWYRLAAVPDKVDLASLLSGDDPWWHSRERDGRVFEVRSGILAWRQEEGVDFLLRMGEGELPLRVLLEALAGKTGAPEAWCLDRVTRVGLYSCREGSLRNPFGDQVVLWKD